MKDNKDVAKGWIQKAKSDIADISAIEDKVISMSAEGIPTGDIQFRVPSRIAKGSLSGD